MKIGKNGSNGERWTYKSFQKRRMKTKKQTNTKDSRDLRLEGDKTGVRIGGQGRDEGTEKLRRKREQGEEK